MFLFCPLFLKVSKFYGFINKIVLNLLQLDRDDRIKDRKLYKIIYFKIFFSILFMFYLTPSLGVFY